VPTRTSGWRSQRRPADSLSNTGNKKPSAGTVVAVEPLAATAGGGILARGGNAADAALAAAFVQGVVNPIACGVGGGLHAIFYEAASGKITTLDAGGCAPKAAHDRLWEPAGNWMTQFRVVGEANRWGYQASTVPGFVRGAGAIFDRFGSGQMKWGELVESAITFAANGFVVSPFLYKEWMPNQYSNGFLGDGPKTLGYTEEGKRIFLGPNGEVPAIGATLVQSDYAATLGRIAEQGPDEFYLGSTARALVDDFQAHAGLLTDDDLTSFKARFEEPLASTFNGLALYAETAPTLGPTFFEMMNVIEEWDLLELGWNTPRYLDKLARAMHVAFRDRAEVIGDPDFVPVPLERLMSKDYAADLRAGIDRQTAAEPAPGQVASTARGHTTHVTAVDAAGNAACITHSIGSGSGVINPGLGFMNNNHMIMFDPRPGHPNSIASGKRPNGGGDGLLVFREGKLVLAIGSPAGGRKATAIAQILANVFVFGMKIQEAVSAERIHSEDQPQTLILEPGFTSELALALAARGYAIEIDAYTARVAAVSRDPSTGRLQPGCDPRCDAGYSAPSLH